MRKKPFIEHKKITNLVSQLNDEQEKIFVLIYENNIGTKNYSISKMFRMCESLFFIVKNNLSEQENLFLEYVSCKSSKRKIEIKYGNSAVKKYENRLKKRERPKTPNSIFDYKFWMKKGFLEREAKEKVTEIQKNNVKKRKKESYNNFSEKVKHSVDYWTKQGYTLNEAEILRKPYLNSMKNDLESLIEKHGEDLGTKMWVKRCDKYKETMRKNLSNKRTGGYVSKESLEFFIPLYKFCRRLGIKRKEIYFGINGSREFFIRDNNFIENGGKFYDFCIPNLNIIIEYHGTFWHARNLEEWKNPWMDFETVEITDLYKRNLAKSRNIEYHIVWSDDDKNSKYDEMCSIIKGKYNGS